MTRRQRKDGRHQTTDGSNLSSAVCKLQSAVYLIINLFPLPFPHCGKTGNA
jgi:hypothetical protein